MKQNSAKQTKTSGQSDTKSFKNASNDVRLSTADICKIIKHCKSNGVTFLAFGGLQIYLSNSAEPFEPSAPPYSDPTVSTFPDHGVRTNARTPEARPEPGPEVEHGIDNQLAQLMVTNPEAAEALQMDADLEDSDDAGNS